MPNLQRGAMPQFCLLFYAILQSWRPKGGGHGTMAPPKYASAQILQFFRLWWIAEVDVKLMCIMQTAKNLKIRVHVSVFGLIALANSFLYKISGQSQIII